MEKIDMHREEKSPGYGWEFCGEEHDYGLFKTCYPKDVARLLIREIFSDEEIRKRRFVYVPHTYRGKNSLMDTLDIYCCEKPSFSGLDAYIPKESNPDDEWLKSVLIDHFELLK